MNISGKKQKAKLNQKVNWCLEGWPGVFSGTVKNGVNFRTNIHYFAVCPGNVCVKAGFMVSRTQKLDDLTREKIVKRER